MINSIQLENKIEKNNSVHNYSQNIAIFDKDITCVIHFHCDMKSKWWEYKIVCTFIYKKNNDNISSQVVSTTRIQHTNINNK